jgi:hypothetical protein
MPDNPARTVNSFEKRMAEKRVKGRREFETFDG